jgi:methyltransferase (TIGR00027 family)
MTVELEPERRASQTAVAAAITRAIHYKSGGEPKILRDSISARLLGSDLPSETRPGGTETEAGVLLRSRFAEDRLAEAVQRGVSQLVILGAGLDSFAYRQPSWAHGLRIFEVDHPESLADKKRRLAAGSVFVPGNVAFIPIDFERTTLREGLRDSSLDFAKPTFFTCLGVLGYLTREAVDAIFQLVSEFPTGSEIAFTFFSEAIPAQVREFGAKTNEQLLTSLDTAELTKDLSDKGFGAFVILSPEEAERRYFQNRADGMRPPRFPKIAAALVG